MIEAMACGTPTMAFRCGSVPEIVIHGISGLIVDTMDEGVVKWYRRVAMDRAAFGSVFETRFTGSRMAKDYVKLYESIVECSSAPLPRNVPAATRIALDRYLSLRTVLLLTDIVRVADEYYVRASSALADDRTRVLKCGDTFARLESLRRHRGSGLFAVRTVSRREPSSFPFHHARQPAATPAARLDGSRRQRLPIRGCHQRRSPRLESSRTRWRPCRAARSTFFVRSFSRIASRYEHIRILNYGLNSVRLTLLVSVRRGFR